jgi:hypothetical protein
MESVRNSATFSISFEKLVRIAGLEPANGAFSWFPVKGVSLPFIARRVAANNQ